MSASGQEAEPVEAEGPLLVIAAGGTGGHMFPAQALADVMLTRGWRVALSTDARGARYAGGFAEAVNRHEVSAASFARGGIKGKLLAPFALLRGVAQTRAWFKRARPAVVAGFGGYPSFPAMVAGRLVGAPTVIHEQNGVLGRVNEYFSRRVDAVACGVWPVEGAPMGAKLIHIGNPIRDAARRLAGSAYGAPGLDGPLRLLVFGGSQGAGVFARLLPPAVGLLARSFRARLHVTQQARPEHLDHVRERYAALGVSAEVEPFFDDLPRRIAEAHLVVSRAGASTIAEICAIGRPSLLAPYPHAAADHQTANARALESRRAAELIADATITPERLAQRIGALFAEPQRLRAMADAARSLGRPGAAEDMADLVERLARGRPA